MSKFFKVRFTFTETVPTEGTAEGNSAEEVADNLRNYFSGIVDNFVLHEITEIEPPKVETLPEKPDLRVVN